MRTLLVAIAAMLALAGCADAAKDSPDDQAGKTTEETSVEKSAGKSAAKPKAPAELQFTAKTLDGKEFAGSSLAGKPVVLWFWAPWCPVCNREAPSIAKAAETHGDSVTFVGVAAQDALPAMQEFAEKHGIDAFTNLNDEQAAVWAKFGVTHQPAFAFVSAGGKVEVVKDTMDAAALDAKLEALAG